jgi:hypothetical protein
VSDPEPSETGGESIWLRLWSHLPTAAGTWRWISKLAKRLETVAKLVTYALAALALLSVYIPGLKRIWEEWTMPSAWYQVGTIRLGVAKDKDGRQALLMDGGSYDAAPWHGSLNAQDLFTIKHQDMITDGTAVGRGKDTLRSSVKIVLPKDQCLYVRDISFAAFRPPHDRDDKRATSEEDAKRLSSFSETDRASADAYLRSMMGNAKACQPMKASEQSDAASKAAKDNLPWSYSYDGKAPVCRRVNVWVKAAKVSC